jgi:hypothetical protein
MYGSGVFMVLLFNGRIYPILLPLGVVFTTPQRGRDMRCSDVLLANCHPAIVLHLIDFNSLEQFMHIMPATGDVLSS